MDTTGTPHQAGITHLDGLPWYRAAIPPTAHECWPQSQHRNPDGVLWLERCPCGGARVHHPAAGDWFGRDTRATGRVLSPTLIRLAAARAHRRATATERQAPVTGDRQVIQCNYLETTRVAARGAHAYVVQINPATGNDRIAVLVRSHSGRWVQRWESAERLGGFHVQILTPKHAHHGDRRIRDFTDTEAERFLATTTPTPPRADVAAAMTKVHAGGAR